MKSNVATLADKRRRIVAAAQRRLVNKVNTMPVEEAAARLVSAIKTSGPMHKRAIYRKTRLIGPALDAAAKHAGLKIEQRPAHPNGGGPLTTWYSLAGRK